MINDKKNELKRTWSQRLVQIMKNITPKEVTVEQFDQIITNMKQNPKEKLHITPAQIHFWNILYKEIKSKKGKTN